MTKFLPNNTNQAFEVANGDPTVVQTLVALLYSIDRLTKYEWEALFYLLRSTYGLSEEMFAKIFLNISLDQDYSDLDNISQNN
jgi:hypothetical protein